ncbi:MAG: aspartate aminotransferase family protein [Deltaproteobacteria bacterium]|nr:aspartate aminotransferase family protein [Deltaproteobacteria bacterium]
MPMKELIDKSEQYIFPTYTRFPIVLTRGKGMKVWDSKGKEYLDFVSGIAVLNVGHCHPRVVEAICQQSKLLMHVSNLYYSEPQVKLAELLVVHSFADKVFFCNSGAEANEAAIKLARKFFKDKEEPHRYEIITMENSFHGRTMATLSATAQKKFHHGIEPLLSGFSYVPFNNAQTVKEAITDDTCAVMVEPIQGEGGVNCPLPDYLKHLRAICDEHGLLLIFDEVQVGMGRTGKLFAHQHYGVEPDIMTLAKALAWGMPIGAMLANKKCVPSFSPGTHASTFGGNLLSTAAGVATIEALLNENILDNCQKMVEYFYSKLSSLKDKHPAIKRVKGKGLLLGIEIGFEVTEIVKECLEKGILINCTMGNILRFIPPLIITEKEVDILIGILDELFTKKQLKSSANRRDRGERRGF